MYMCINICRYMNIYTYIYIYICICIYNRNYALAVASASFPPGSLGNPLGITLGSWISKPTVMIIAPRIHLLNRFSYLFRDC